MGTAFGGKCVDPPQTSEQEQEDDEKQTESKEDIIARQQRAEKRTAAIKELLETEQTYIDGLQLCIHAYYNGLSQNKKIINTDDLKKIFNDIEMIYKLNQTFFDDLESRYNSFDNDTTMIGDRFLEFTPYFKMYQNYCNNYDQSTVLMNKYCENESFTSLLSEIRDRCNGKTLNGLLILPIQRLPRYKLCLSEILKNTECNHPDLNNLTNSLESVEQTTSLINERMKEFEQRQQVRLIEARFKNDKKIHYLVESLRKFGCYARNSACLESPKYAKIPSFVKNWWIQIIICLYHFGNVLSVIATFLAHKHTFIHTDWCPSVEWNIGMLQFESFVLYGLSLWALRYHYHIIREILYKYYKPLGRKKVFLIIMAIIVPFITGFFTGIDDENWEFGKKGWFGEFILYLFDVIRYIQPAATIVILYGHLDTFCDVFVAFKKKTGTNTSEIDDGLILKIVDFDLNEFKQKFKEMTKPYTSVLTKFMHFIAWFLIFNLGTVGCILWSLVLVKKEKGCTLSAYYYVHYLCEIIYFLGLWLGLAFKLNRNHQLIIDYKDDLMDKSSIDMDTIKYLEFVIERKSPFAIFGVINPSNQTFGLLVTSVVFPLSAQIVQAAGRSI